jgi:hypothetical protein
MLLGFVPLCRIPGAFFVKYLPTVTAQVVPRQSGIKTVPDRGLGAADPVFVRLGILFRLTGVAGVRTRRCGVVTGRLLGR